MFCLSARVALLPTWPLSMEFALESPPTDRELITKLEEGWRSVIPESERLLFLRLTVERQRMALQRIDAMNELQDGKKPAEIYPKIGLSKAQFYRLAKAWREEKSIAALVPFASDESRAKKTRLKGNVLTLIEETYSAIKEKGEITSERQLFEAVRVGALELGITPPARETVSRQLAKLAQRGTEIPVSRAIAIPPGDNPGDLFAGHLLVDHVTVDLIVSHEEDLIKPTLSLVIDDASHLVLGACLSPDYPTPGSVAHAMWDAGRRYRELRGHGVHAVLGLRPFLSARFPLVEGWEVLEHELEKAGFSLLHMNRPEFIHHRGYGRLIGRFNMTKIGDIALTTLPTWMPPRNRVSKDERRLYRGISWDDAVAMVTEGIWKYNELRMDAARVHSQRTAGDLSPKRIEDRDIDYLDQILSAFAAVKP